MSHCLRLRIEFTSRRDARERVRRVVAGALEPAAGAGFRRVEVDEILVAVSESLANVARHAYAGAERGIELRLALTPGRMVAEIVDRGRPAAAERLVVLAPDAPRSGGRGLWLMTRTMDRVEYRRTRGRNVLRLERSARPERRPPAGPRGGAAVKHRRRRVR